MQGDVEGVFDAGGRELGGTADVEDDNSAVVPDVVEVGEGGAGEGVQRDLGAGPRFAFDNNAIRAWGEGGLDQLVVGGSWPQLSPRQLVGGSVMGAGSQRSSILALTSDGPVTIDRATRRAETNTVIRGDLIAVTNDAVVVSSRDGLDVFGGSRVQAQPATHLAVTSECLYTSVLARPSRVIAETRDGAIEIDVANPDSARITSSWSATPEHVRAAATGVIVATRGSREDTVSILTRAQRRQV